MYDKKSRYIEKEFGTKAVFDDAKDGEYIIRACRGDGGTEFKSTHKGGKEFAEVSVMAHLGETIKLVFDYKKKTVSMTTDYVKPVSKVIAKPVPKKQDLVTSVALVSE